MTVFVALLLAAAVGSAFSRGPDGSSPMVQVTLRDGRTLHGRATLGEDVLLLASVGAPAEGAAVQSVAAADVLSIVRLATPPPAGPASPLTGPTPPPPVTPAASGPPVGLLGEYFGDTELSDWLFDRLDAEVNFDGRGDAPPRLNLPGVPSAFSVRWTGFLVPPVTGTYRFWVSSDDGARVWVGETVVSDLWGSRVLRDVSATVRLTAGQPVPLRIDYMDIGGGQFFRLEWEARAERPAGDAPGGGRGGAPGDASADVGFDRRPVGSHALRPPERVASRVWPGEERRGGWQGTYFAAKGFEERFGVQTSFSSVMEWGSGAPVPGMRTAGGPWSAVFEGRLYPPVAGRYGLQVHADDRARVSIDGRVVLDTFDRRGFFRETEVELPGDRGVSLRVEYENEMGDAFLRLRWRLPGTREWREIPASSLGLPEGPDVSPLVWVDRRTVPTRFFTGEAGSRAIEARVWTADGTVSRAEWLVGATVLPVETAPGSDTVRLSWSRIPVGQQSIQLRLTDGAGRHAVSSALVVEAEGLEGGVLEGPWRDVRIGGSNRPADVSRKPDGRIELVGWPGDLELQSDTLRLVCRPIADGQTVTTTLFALDSETGAYAVGGLMLRESHEPMSGFVAAAIDTEGRLRLITRPAPWQPVRTIELPVAQPLHEGVRLRWVREGLAVRLLLGDVAAGAARRGQAGWRTVYRGHFTGSGEAWCGVFAVSRAGRARLVTSPPELGAAEPPAAATRGVLLTTGSFLAGDVGLSRSPAGEREIELWRDGNAIRLPWSSVAMISFDTVPSAAWATASMQAPAVLLRGEDVLPGELTRLEGGRLELETMLFGRRELRAGDQAMAVVLQPLSPDSQDPAASAAVALRLEDGSVLRGRQLSISPQGLQVLGSGAEGRLPPVPIDRLAESAARELP